MEAKVNLQAALRVIKENILCVRKAFKLQLYCCTKYETMHKGLVKYFPVEFCMHKFSFYLCFYNMYNNVKFKKRCFCNYLGKL